VSIIFGIVISLAFVSVHSFQAVSHGQHRAVQSSLVVLNAKQNNNEQSRGTFLSSVSTILASTILLPSQPALADEPRSISACKIGAKNCVSTLNIKQLESYSPPWTFEVAPDEAFARIKGVLASDDAFRVTDIDDENRYIKAKVARVFPDQDEVELLVKGDDKVVVFRCSEREEGLVGDFGEINKRMESVRKRGAVFDVMGGGLTADSYDGGGAARRGNGALGQLKAFYGLQSGQGFEAVFEDEDE